MAGSTRRPASNTPAKATADAGETGEGSPYMTKTEAAAPKYRANTIHVAVYAPRKPKIE